MTTTPSTTPSTTSSTSSTPTPSAPARRRTSGKMVTGLVAAGLAIAGLATVTTIAVTQPAAAHEASGGSSSSSSTGHHSDTPVAPSAKIKKLQQELAQLNYYDGPINGYLNNGTVQAITYLQRDAGLPQTGRMDHASDQALAKMLVNGNNHMGGNGTPAQPSASVKLLQQQLAQLNYYNGPITGVDNTATQQAITYLQRDAHQPQTGHMDSATRAALAKMLANGNNQMAG